MKEAILAKFPRGTDPRNTGRGLLRLMDSLYTTKYKMLHKKTCTEATKPESIKKIQKDM